MWDKSGQMGLPSLPWILRKRRSFDPTGLTNSEGRAVPEVVPVRCGVDSLSPMDAQHVREIPTFIPNVPKHAMPHKPEPPL